MKGFFMSTPSQLSDTLFMLEGPTDFQQHSLQLTQNARRHIAILSHTLDAHIYDNEAFSLAISALARSSSYAQIQLLVKHTDPLIERAHRLARLSQRLSSKIALRKLTLEPTNSEMEFMLCDATGLVFKNDAQTYRGFADSNAAAETKRLREIFDYLWQYAEPEPRLQLLHI
jgi:hypothetical protein